jgi:LytR cell envelope-related transcriptional attenuator
LAGVLVVCLGIAVLVVAVVALREPKGHVTGQRASNVGDRSSAAAHSASPPAKGSTTPTRSRSSAPRIGDSRSSSAAKSVPIIVLNNTTVPGLAKQAAQRFEGGGWTVTRFDNYQNDIVSTCAYYDPSADGAEAAAKALRKQFPAIKRVKERFPELPTGPVVVVLTPDYSAT